MVRDNQRDTEGCVETASATTSRDNQNSGPFAYIIAGIALIVVTAMALGAAGCVSFVLAEAARYSALPGSGSSGNGYGLEDFDIDEFMELRNEDYGYRPWSDPGSGQTTGAKPGNAGTATVREALDFDLALYGPGIDGEVSASSYAGVSDDVRAFVRELIAIDGDCATKVARALDAAALSEEGEADKVKEAAGQCSQAAKEIDALELPTLPDDGNGEVKDLLGTAKATAVRRWDCMASEIELLQGDDVDTKRLWERDGEVVEATEKAGDQLEDAMAAAAR